ncbi:hypothetical protein QBC36DRAFT_377345 [Triangularia setosa]|uniref:J domain-containing protein n=1 Tax=Triangularia setosa TaxID=2587417 RepID=A0AAN7A921_9PEZI|nr:hypothetical protein QBC36DRAFT_377345 [Podospora setosa]
MASLRRLALLWHPDKCPAPGVQAIQKLQEINNAHEVLSEDGARARYDEAAYGRLYKIESVGIKDHAKERGYDPRPDARREEEARKKKYQAWEREFEAQIEREEEAQRKKREAWQQEYKALIKEQDEV